MRILSFIAADERATALEFLCFRLLCSNPRWKPSNGCGTAVAREWDRLVLLLNDPGGVLLSQPLGQPLDVAFSLRLAVSLSTAIGKLHQRGVIHKDLKPYNVLLNSVTGQCWLTGFGIASRLPRERQPPEPPELIAGTLACMAPRSRLDG